ncbi:MAG: YceH family protein [Bryobacteraceae bacterium]
MDWQLDAAEARVLGALLEKEIATPEYYPLSLNALLNACNQKSNREPVVAYDESTVEATLEDLRRQGLATRLTGRDIRVPKHAQRFTEQFNLGRREAAVLCLLLLRGPQTVGELRGRSDRLYQFDDLEAVETTLQHLSESGLVMRLTRLAGSREPRWAHLLSGQPEAGVENSQAPSAPAPHLPATDRIAALERDFAALRREFDDFRKRFD